MPVPLDLAEIPRERWAGALAATMLNGFRQRPDVLMEIVSQGKKKFVAIGVEHDQIGLTATDYELVFKRLAQTARRWASALPRVRPS